VPITPQTVATVRARISTAISTALAGAGWRESRVVFDLFPGDTRQIVHKSYAVGVTSTAPATTNERQTPHRGSVVQTRVAVRFCARVRADAQVSDYAAALVLEADLLEAIKTAVVMLTYRGTTQRTVTGDGTLFLCEVEWSALHRIALST